MNEYTAALIVIDWSRI